MLKPDPLKVLVLGYGAREHALAWKIAQSPRVAQVFIAPGNAGTEDIATNVPISDEDIPGLVAFATEEGIDLTVVGTNDPLALGAVDAFQEAGLAIFGPTQAAAALETSKAFAKAFMARHGIPTPAFQAFDDFKDASAFLDTLPENKKLVVKVSGLGHMGMGVTVCDSREQARETARSYMLDGHFGDSARKIVIEERAYGEEASIFALSDGRDARFLMAVRDHKRIYDGDDGPNTGGMGAYGPPPDIDDTFVNEVMDTIIQPTIEGMAAEGRPYVGVLYAGMMLTKDRNVVLEFNCRFGNPEALVIMAMLENDLVDLLEACLTGRLASSAIHIREGAAAAVVISSPDYPGEQFPLGLPITGIRKLASSDMVNVFHHGTELVDGRFVTSRGRVLAVSATGEDLSEALQHVYAGVRKISFEGAHYRTDIGARQVAH